jgi:hypothetical protein
MIKNASNLIQNISKRYKIAPSTPTTHRKPDQTNHHHPKQPKVQHQIHHFAIITFPFYSQKKNTKRKYVGQLIRSTKKERDYLLMTFFLLLMAYYVIFLQQNFCQFLT